MLPDRFQLKSLTNTLRVDNVSLDRMPKPGDTLTIFNFPVVERYVIDRLEPRSEWWPHDHFHRFALIVHLQATVAHAAARSNVLAFNQDGEIETRLAKIEPVARTSIDDGMMLEISHDDFLALCHGSCLSVPVSSIAAFAYHDIPMKIGERGEWNAATAFTGYSDDRHVLYVTCPGGTPFVMNRRLLDTSKQFYACLLSLDQALAVALAEAIAQGCAESHGLQSAMRNMFGLMQDGLMPVYDGAQELTRMTQPAYAATLQTSWADYQPQAAIENAKSVETSGAKVDVEGLVDLFSAPRPVRH